MRDANNSDASWPVRGNINPEAYVDKVSISLRRLAGIRQSVQANF